jgi:hypothetical protein
MPIKSRSFRISALVAAPSASQNTGAEDEERGPLPWYVGEPKAHALLGHIACGSRLPVPSLQRRSSHVC